MKEWRLHQAEHMKAIRMRRCPLLWMARLQRKIWEIAWTMWEHRNNTLHNDGTTFHQHEMRAVDSAIVTEWTNGLDGLPPQHYSFLFTGSLQLRLSENIHQKQMWLCTVWSARDRQMTNNTRQQNDVALAFFEQWKARVGGKRAYTGNIIFPGRTNGSRFFFYLTATKKLTTVALV